MTSTYLVGNVLERLDDIPPGSVDLVVTSPPFLGLRSYLPDDHPDKDKEIGSEPTPAEFIDVLLAVTAKLRRVLAPHGSLCVELGDTYSGSGGAGGDYSDDGAKGGQPKFRQSYGEGWPLPKSKALIPEAYQIGLAYGINPLTGAESPAGRWLVRNVVTWCRPSPMVGRLGDKWRPATSDIAVACTSPSRYWDDIATRNPHVFDPESRAESSGRSPKRADGDGDSGTWNSKGHPAGAPLLDYWEVSTAGGFSGPHYAVYPPDLIEPLIKAMAPEKVCRKCGMPSTRLLGERTYQSDRPRHNATTDGRKEFWDEGNGRFGTLQVETLGWSDCGHDNWRPGVVLDPFAGSGTTLHVADALGRDAIGIDLDERNQTIYQKRRDERKFNLLRQGTLL